MHSPSVSRTASREPLYRSTSLETRSRSPSPRTVRRAGREQQGDGVEYYGGVNLTDRSRTPSPASTATSERATLPLGRKLPMSPNTSNLPQGGRRLPNLPQKPSTLNIPPNPPPLGMGRRTDNMPHVLPSPTLPEQPHRSPGSINFPRLNPSPTHYPAAGPRFNRRDVMTNNLNRPPSHAQQMGAPRHAFHNGTPPSQRRHRGMGRRTNSSEAAWGGEGGGRSEGHASLPRSCSGQQFTNNQQHQPSFHHRAMQRPPHNPAMHPQYAQPPGSFHPRHRHPSPDAFDNNRFLAERYDQEMAMRQNRRNTPNADPFRPLPNGFKPPSAGSGRAGPVRGSSGVGSESDDDDWC